MEKRDLCPVQTRNSCQFFNTLKESGKNQSTLDLISIGCALFSWFVLGNNIRNMNWFATVIIYAVSFIPFVALFNRSIPRDALLNTLFIIVCIAILFVGLLGSQGIIKVNIDDAIQTSTSYVYPGKSLIQVDVLWWISFLPVSFCIIQWTATYARTLRNALKAQ